MPAILPTCGRALALLHDALDTASAARGPTMSFSALIRRISQPLCSMRHQPDKQHQQRRKRQRGIKGQGSCTGQQLVIAEAGTAADCTVSLAVLKRVNGKSPLAKSRIRMSRRDRRCDGGCRSLACLHGGEELAKRAKLSAACQGAAAGRRRRSGLNQRRSPAHGLILETTGHAAPNHDKRHKTCPASFVQQGFTPDLNLSNRDRETSMRRIALFLLTNIAVLVLLSVVCHLFGIDQMAASRGYGGMGGLLAFAAVFGMGGAFISLAMSKWIAKRSTWRASDYAGRRTTPSAGCSIPCAGTRRAPTSACRKWPSINAPEMNAFATGMPARINSHWVAVSSGLLQQMDREQIKAVLGHEIGHVANGDMVTLTLIQGRPQYAGDPGRTRYRSRGGRLALRQHATAAAVVAWVISSS